MSKKRIPWQQEFEWAQIICAPLGCSVERSTADYEIAKVKGEGVSLVIYPHTTRGTGNQHARVRDNSSKDKSKAHAVMRALKLGQGLPADVARTINFSCTFSWKHMSWGDLAQR